MKQIVFDGYLADMYPAGIRVAASTAAEAISALRNFAGFRESDGVRHTVTLPDFQSTDSLYEDTDAEVIRVTPVVVGAGGGGGLFQVVIGAVLIVAGVFFQQPWMVKLGAAMVISGVVQMLMPAPEISSGEDESKKSNYLPANKNTTKVGTRIGLLFGRRKVWPHILTFNVTATNMPAPAADPAAGTWFAAIAYAITTNDRVSLGRDSSGPGDAGVGGGNGADPNVGDGSGNGGPGF